MILTVPAEFNVPDPIMAPSAKKVTVPVGIPPVAEETFAVIVRGWNCGSDAEERMTAVLVVPVVTVTLSAGAVLAA